MSYKDDFDNTVGWSVIDTNIKLDTEQGKKFLSYLRQIGVNVIIRYYASTPKEKVLTVNEAKLLSQAGFSLVTIFQDSSRKIENFSAESGKKNAISAMKSAEVIGQPQGSTILFAVDWDYSVEQINSKNMILAYFKAVNKEIAGKFKIGAYGSGSLLSKLLNEKLITVPWLSMSPSFLGTEAFFYSNQWMLRQLRPELKHPSSGLGYDRNILRVSLSELGTFQIDSNGKGVLDFNSDINDNLLTLNEDIIIDNSYFITTEGVRFRENPKDGLIIKELTIGDKVIFLEKSSIDGWSKIQFNEDEGFIADRYLRKPKRNEIEKILKVALNEWIRFDKGNAFEKNYPYYEYVGEMWANLKLSYDGRSKDKDGKDIPWSAAFISWIVEKSGISYKNFKFSSRHSEFVNDAINSRFNQIFNKPFWGYMITEAKPELGDIIQKNRDRNEYSFSYAENNTRYESHSDIVIEVRSDIVRVLGGNVGDSINIKEYFLDENGYLKPNQKIISLLKNRAGL